MIVSDKRTLDVDGRLHITDCRLTAARVNEYLGSEIPESRGLRLPAGTGCSATRKR